MTLHAHPISTVSRPVMLFIADNKIDCETVVVDLMTGEHMQEPFAKLNPNKLVPVLEDGDLVLTESSAILKYLADKIGSSTYPKDLVKRAKVNEKLDWFNTGLYRDYGYNMVYPQVYPHHKRSPDEANKTVMEWGKTNAQNWLGVLNDHYLGSGQKYLCGDDLSIADYFGAGILSVGDLVGVSFGNYANVNRWMDTMKQLPSWASVTEAHNGFAGSLKGQSFVTIS